MSFKPIVFSPNTPLNFEQLDQLEKNKAAVATLVEESCHGVLAISKRREQLTFNNSFNFLSLKNVDLAMYGNPWERYFKFSWNIIGNSQNSTTNHTSNSSLFVTIKDYNDNFVYYRIRGCQPHHDNINATSILYGEQFTCARYIPGTRLMNGVQNQRTFILEFIFSDRGGSTYGGASGTTNSWFMLEDCGPLDRSYSFL